MNGFVHLILDAKLGSGGGTTWLLETCKKETAQETPLSEWLACEKRILLHAGGQSRRLPGYASSGKILTPIPVFDWERGQRLGQNLLSLQLPLYRKMMDGAPQNIHMLIASGDVYVRAEAIAGNSGCGCRLLWIMGRCFSSNAPWCICDETHRTRGP